MSEIKLQSEVVIAFSQKYPKKRGQLFHVANERNHALQAIQARGIGIFPGVSDLIFVDGISPRKKELLRILLSSKKQEGLLKEILDVLDINELVLIELKEPGTRHIVDHIKQQVEWAKTMESNGCVWRLCTNVEDALSCTEHNYNGFTIKDVETMIELNKNKKTLKF